MFNTDLFQKIAEGKWLLIGIVTCVVISLLVLRTIIYQAKKPTGSASPENDGV